MNDLISRQAAIDAIKEEEYPRESDYDEGYMAALKKSVWIMEKWLPSAQPDSCEFYDTESHFCALHRPPAQPDAEYISQQAVTKSDLIDWYINSVDESEPVWTEEHIYELFNDFYLIPKENR